MEPSRTPRIERTPSGAIRPSNGFRPGWKTKRIAEGSAGVILFGSHAGGEADPRSDLDLLVIEPALESRRAEFVRLREEPGRLKLAIDLVLVSDRHVEEWGHFEGTMLNDALNEGRVLAGA